MGDMFNVIADKLEFKSQDGNYFVEGILEVAGYVDSVNDVVTKDCILDMANQIKNQEVKAMFKGNLDHEHISKDLRIVPRAKIVDAEVKGEKLVVKTMLNKHHPDFQNLWGSISDGFLDAFSMEFRPIEWTNQQFGGKPVRVLNKVQLGGVAFTGRPINDACKITEFFCKSKAMMDEDKEMDDDDKKEMETMMKNGMSKDDAMKKMKDKKKKMMKKSFTEEENMAENPNTANVTPAQVPVDYSKEVMELKSQVEKLTSSLEAKSKEIEALKKVEVKSLTETEVKSLVDEALKNMHTSKPVHETEQAKFEVKSIKTIGDAFASMYGMK